MRLPATALSRDRIVVLLALLGVTVLAWLYLLADRQRMADMVMSDMPDMANMAMPMTWGPTEFALTFAMWWIMMLGMMLPSAAPTILTFATMARRQRARATSRWP